MVARTNLTIHQGTTFSSKMILEDDVGVFNLSGYTVAAQMRKSWISESFHAFMATHNDSGGEITLFMSDEETSLIEPGRYLYDTLIESPGGSKEKIAYGIVDVIPGITRNG